MSAAVLPCLVLILLQKNCFWRIFCQWCGKFLRLYLIRVRLYASSLRSSHRSRHHWHIHIKEKKLSCINCKRHMRHFQAAGGYNNLIRVAQGPKQRRISQTANKTKQKKKTEQIPSMWLSLFWTRQQRLPFLNCTAKVATFISFSIDFSFLLDFPSQRLRFGN